MWYGGSVTGGIFIGDNPKEGHWEDLQKVVGEIHSLSEVLMSPSVDPPTVSPDAPISTMLKRAPDRLVLVAVNRGPDATEVTLSSPRLTNGSAKVLHENRTVRISGGALRDRFDPYGVHVYELSR
jgi:hypothetical protein